MSCEICGRNSCTRSFHSLEMQERFDRIKNNPNYGRAMLYSEAKQQFEYMIENELLYIYNIEELEDWIEDYYITIIK